MGRIPIYMAFFKDDGWLIDTPKEREWNKIPESLSKHLGANVKTIRWIDAGGDDNFCLLYDARDKSKEKVFHSVNDECREAMDSMSPDLKGVSIGVDGSFWCVGDKGNTRSSTIDSDKPTQRIWESSGMQYLAFGTREVSVGFGPRFIGLSNVPEGLSNALQNAGHRKIRFITLSSYNSAHYFVQFDDDSIAYCVPQSCAEKAASLMGQSLISVTERTFSNSTSSGTTVTTITSKEPIKRSGFMKGMARSTSGEIAASVILSMIRPSKARRPWPTLNSAPSPSEPVRGGSKSANGNNEHDEIGANAPLLMADDAPFIIRPPTTHGQALSRSGSSKSNNNNARDERDARRRSAHKSTRGMSLGTVHGETNIEGTLYWNQDVVSSGLVCGTSSKQILRTVMQMVRLHLDEGRNSSALIFHSSPSDHLLPPSRVETVQLAKRLSSPSVIISPRARPAVKARYLSIPLPEQNVLPLRIAEKDISLAHVLSLCTPPSDYPSRDRILTSVQYIVSRMAEPFSIQEFNQLVDGESWDEHGSSFMAIRQTLLTSLAIPDSEPNQPNESVEDTDDIVSCITRGGPIIVDLSDPVLRSAGLDSVLFDMILCLYCVINPDSQKLLVLDAHEYLVPSINTSNPPSLSGSDLTNTLTSLLSLHTDSPIKTLISCSADLAYIPPRVFGHLDYLICHEFRSPTWVEYIQKNYFTSPSSAPPTAHHPSSPLTGLDSTSRRGNSSVYSLEDRHAIIISPRSVSIFDNGSHGISLSPIVEEGTSIPIKSGSSSGGIKWGARSFRAEIGWEWPLTVEQQKIEQLQALVAQLSQISHNRDQHHQHHHRERDSLPAAQLARTDTVKTAVASEATLAAASGNAHAQNPSGGSAVTAASTTHRRSRKESSTYVETTMTALKSALGYLASRRAVDLSSPPPSPKEGGGSRGLLPLVLPSSRTPPPQQPVSVERMLEKMREQSGDSTDPSTDDAAWLKKRGLDAKFTMPSRVKSLQDLGPFNGQNPDALEIDKDKLTDALYQSIVRAGGARGMPISSQKVAEQYKRLTSEATSELGLGETAAADTGLSMWNGVPALTAFATWPEAINVARREGILQIVSNGKEEWIVMPKDPTPPSGRRLSVVQSPDGWYEAKSEPEVDQAQPVAEAVTFPPLPDAVATAATIKESQNAASFDPLVQSITTLRQLQNHSSPLLLHSVSYELKRRFPTALRDSGYQTIMQYLQAAQDSGLVEVTDDNSGSIFVQLTVPIVHENKGGNLLMPPTMPAISVSSRSTDKSQPESSAMPSSEVYSQGHVPFPRNRFEPIVSVLRYLRKHNLYKVALSPLDVTIEKMFPNALSNFGFINIEAYVIQARDAGLVITGVDAHGKPWVSLVDDMIDTNGSTTPTQEQPRPKRHSIVSAYVTAADFPLPPPSRVSDFSRLLRAIRALSSPGHERVLCSRVGMMLNKEDYKAMNVETFSQSLIAAAKANLVVHGGVGGNAWVSLKAPEVAGVSTMKREEPRSRLVKSSPPEFASNPVVPSGSAYKLPLSEQDVEPFKPLVNILRHFIHGKHIAEPFRTVVEKNLLKLKPDLLMNSRYYTMDDYILQAQSYGLIAQVGNGKAARLRLLENSGLAPP